MAQKILGVCRLKFTVANILNQNADPDSYPLKILGVKICHHVFTSGFAKFKPVVLQIETFLTSQNLTKYRVISSLQRGIGVWGGQNISG